MVNIFAKGSRLIVIFILTVIVSGSILTYLSITHISNYRELLEKKISEEERELTRRFSSGFQNELDSITILFSEYVEHEELSNLESFKKIDAIAGVINYIVINTKGSFLVPYFTNNLFYNANTNPSVAYIERLRTAENKEFISKNFKSAELSYLKTLKAAETKSDSAHIYNSMGRLYVKMNLQQNAFNTYQIILEKFRNTSNSSGFPYAYFSIIKLLKISNSSNHEQLQELVLSFLNELADGTIPLNDSSGELLNAIVVWQDKHKDALNNERFDTLITLNRNSLSLINNYKTSIKDLLKDDSGKLPKNKNDDFISVKPSSGSPNELMLFFKGQTNSVGFVIGLKAIFTAVLQNQQMNTTKFDYTLSLIKKTNDNFLANETLITLSEFSPYFEDSLIQVSLKNDSIIKDTVFKRKIIYGIGLCMFLAIMVFGLYLLIQDIQREKRMHKLRADFVSNVTHELKTPLTSIYMFAEALNMRQDKLDSKQKKYTNIIVKESEKLKRLINNILEFSKTESNKLTYTLETANLTNIVNETLKEMSYFLEINNFDVNLNIEKNVFAKVNAEGIKQALSNLISNAIKYSSTCRKLNISLTKNVSKILIEVEDFGNGIPKDQLKLIFEKFHRVNSTENETISGTGLGLTVTKDIIEEQHGKLLVESNLGEGSKFTIVLNTM